MISFSYKWTGCIFILFLLGCSHIKEEYSQEDDLLEGAIALPSYPQRHGDAAAGREYLLYGNYISSGFPYEAFSALVPDDPDNDLQRTGDNAALNFAFSAVDAPNGVRIVAPNCLQCHAQKLLGKFYLGMGNTRGDFHKDYADLFRAGDIVMNVMYNRNSPEWEVYQPIRDAAFAVSPYLLTEVRGPNPADKLVTSLAAHRDPVTLAWQDNPVEPIPPYNDPTDVPPWWNYKKKNAMFYTAYGRGDFCKMLMLSSLLTMGGLEEAKAVDANFPDILAYLYTLEPPEFPGTVDQTLAAEGRMLFKENCQSCHGTYGTEETYPNLLIPLRVIQTDPTLSESVRGENFRAFKEWFNEGWFGNDENPGAIITQDGYVAPPLDGIWATAPYLHNASVPTLADLLFSPQRPTYWRRNYNPNDYEIQNMVGWIYETLDHKKDKHTYDTTLKGYSNEGHTFSDHLSEQERKALLEYLKTL